METKLEKEIKVFLQIKNGSGYGYGDGSGYGYGDGSGYGYGLKKLNNTTIYLIDNIPTILIKVKSNIAKGYIVNNDLTFTNCYIVKNKDFFAHGETAKQAKKSLEDKIISNMDIDEVIKLFTNKFKKDIKYSAETFYDWHYRLTGSCEFGRKNFMKNNNISFNDKFTVNEFIKLTKDNYKGDIIEKLKDYYK